VRADGSWESEKCRAFPGNSNLVTKTVGFEPFDGTRPADPFERDVESPDGTYGRFLKVTINYITWQNEMMEVTASTTGEFILLPPRGSYTWESTPSETGPDGTQRPATVKDINIPLPRILPEMEWTVRYPRIVAEALKDVFTRVRDSLGKVNSETVNLFRQAEAETVLFSGFSMKYKWSWRSADPSAECEFKFLERGFKDDGPSGTITVTHNHVINPRTGLWDILKKPDGNKIYKSYDLNQLFYEAKDQED
jgi:hypothetical protein